LAAKLTVLIPCKDERLNIGPCIQSIRPVQEKILVVDSGSTGGTLRIVRSPGDCRLVHRDLRLRLALTLWGALAVAVCLQPVWHQNGQSVSPACCPVFPASSRHWWADMSLYADYVLTEHVDSYRYSPTFAIAFTPFAYMPWPCGGIVWEIGSIAVLLLSLYVMAREILPGTGVSAEPSPSFLSNGADSPVSVVNIRHSCEGPFLMLAMAGLLVGIWSGQTNAMVTALMILGLAATLRQRWWTAAFLLAASVFIKLWPMAMVLLLMTFWPRQLTGRFLLACTVFALVPFLTRPPETVAWQYIEWYRALTGPLQAHTIWYRDAWTIWDELCPPVHHGIYRALQLASAAGVLCWCLWQRRQTLVSNHLVMRVFSMWAAWQLLFGPGAEQLTYGILAPSASWAVLVSYAEKKARWLTTTVWAMLMLFGSGDIESMACQVFPAGKILMPLAVVLFLAWLLWHERGPAGVHGGLYYANQFGRWPVQLPRRRLVGPPFTG
jgi:hypothetical protein